jgi:hypothetical protein
MTVSNQEDFGQNLSLMQCSSRCSLMAQSGHIAMDRPRPLLMFWLIGLIIALPLLARPQNIGWSNVATIETLEA